MHPSELQFDIEEYDLHFGTPPASKRGREELINQNLDSIDLDAAFAEAEAIQSSTHTQVSRALDAEKMPPEENKIADLEIS